MQLLGYIISAAGPISILYFYYEQLLQRKSVSTKIVISTFLGAIILLTIQTEIAYNITLNSIITVLIMFILSFFYREFWYQRLFLSLSFYVISALAEGSGWLMGRLFFHVEMTKANESQQFLLMCALGVVFDFLYILVALFAIKLFKRHKQRLRTFILFLIVVLVYSIIVLLVTFADTSFLVPSLILSTLLIGAIAGCLYLFDDQLKTQRDRLQRQHLETMLEDQVAHYSALYQSNQQVAALKHDLKNIMLNIRSYIQLKEYDKLDRYVSDYQERLQPGTLIDNGMPFIDAVLSAKMAGHEDVEFSLQISTLELKHIQQSQIAMVLATALDNALDACAGSADPFIEIQLTQQEAMISLVITNSADRPVKAIGSKLLSTKPDRQNHGYGVQNMEHIAAQNYGMLTWSYENRQFRLAVLFQDLPAERL